MIKGESGTVQAFLNAGLAIMAIESGHCLVFQMPRLPGHFLLYSCPKLEPEPEKCTFKFQL